MNDLDWLVGRRFVELVRNECTWHLVFDNRDGISAACLWRLLEGGRIRLTSQDDGHQFGLPAPVDAVVETNQQIAGATVAAVRLAAGTLDLEITFSTGHAIQLLPDSAGYESWQAWRPDYQFIACGGGELVVFGPEDRK
ncbi:MAG TPA: DUF6188 family protein [Pirellulales bacterium]|nr:DUF6188 family protein [Pirellulales bacterium]